MSIKLLNKHTCKQLTTAQIVTSVFSVVKELVENSLDAGANTIEVNLIDNGLTLIEVKDNGKGISKVDCAFMALPSYTSKISNFADLDSLEYYGFRGEALNALCRQSTVKIITRTEEDDVARCNTMDINGSLQKAEFCCRTIGTTVQAQLLFKNFPIRRQFISKEKRANQDVKLIENLLKDYGICRPETRFIYRVENKLIFMNIPGKTIKESLTNIFGKKMISFYEFINNEFSESKIDIIIPKKNTEDLSLMCQINSGHIFVNNRPVSFKEYEKIIVKILSEHFDGKFSNRKRPHFFLLIKVLPSDIDVNLEPNKTTVLLKNNSEILKIVEKLLVEYYEVRLSPDNSQEILPTLNTSLPAYNDFSTIEVDDLCPEPIAKKRKTDKENRKPVSTKQKIKFDNHSNKNKDTNLQLNLFNENKNENFDEHPCMGLSQVPESNLGENFSTQEIERILSEPPLQMEVVTEAIKRLSSTLSDTDVDNVKKNPQLNQISESQWSKGHHNLGIIGGTNVQVAKPSDFSANEITDDFEEDPDILNKIMEEDDEITNAIQKANFESKTLTPQSYATVNHRGFITFSKEYRPQIIKMNPGMNLVEIAQEITSKWKKMSSEEREHYRELGMNDKSLVESPSIPHQTKFAKTSAKNTEKNKKRLIGMLENMKNKKLDDSITKPKENIRLTRTIINWELNINDISHKMNERNHKRQFRKIVGSLNEDIWISKTNSQIWALSANQLFDNLSMNTSERILNKDNPDFIEYCLNRCIREKEGLNFMHAIHEMN